jgi:hypothetical protein
MPPAKKQAKPRKKTGNALGKYETSIPKYLATVPKGQRPTIDAVRAFVNKHIPRGYEEAMNWGVINWQIPLARFPDTYNGFPLTYVGLSARKNYCVLYLMNVYFNKEKKAKLVKAFAAAGKKFDMGGSCLRFKTADDLEFSSVGEIIASTPSDEFIRIYESSRRK